MTAISNSISSQATLAQAQAKLAADQAAKADEATIKADQEAVDEASRLPSRRQPRRKAVVQPRPAA